MADRKDYYFRQKVQESDLDQGFDFMENAIFNVTKDNDLIGINSGILPSQTGSPSLDIQISSGVAYSKQGERINVVGTQLVNISLDENSLGTEPTTPGNSLVISLFLEFDRVLGAAEVDGNSQTVFTLRSEGYNIIVRKGGEAVSPGGGAEVAFITANAVPQDSGLIRICDIIRANGQTTITNANIFTTVFREDAFVYSAGTLSVRAGTIKEADQQNLQALSDHINDVGGAHAGATVAYDSSVLPVPATWSNLDGATTVQGAIDAITVDIGDSTALSDGARLVGFNIDSAQWVDATTISATNVGTAITEIVTDLSNLAGADKIGFSPNSVSWALSVLFSPVNSSVSAAIREIVEEIGSTNGAARVGMTLANTWADGSAITATTQSVRGYFDGIYNVLGGIDGSQKIGNTVVGTALNVGSDNVFKALQDLSNNWGKKSALNDWDLEQTFLGGAKFGNNVNINNSSLIVSADLTPGDRTLDTFRINTHRDHSVDSAWADTAYTHFVTYARQTSASGLSDVIYDGPLNDGFAHSGGYGQMIIAFSCVMHNDFTVATGVWGSYNLQVITATIDDDDDTSASSVSVSSASFGTAPPTRPGISIGFAPAGLTLTMTGNVDTEPVDISCFLIVMQWQNNNVD